MLSNQQLFKLLADETRLRLLNILFYGPLCVCQLTGVLQEPQSKISRHLSRLREGGLVLTTRQEQFIFYRLNHEIPLLLTILNEMRNEKGDNLYKKDQQRLTLKETFLAECIPNK